MSPEKTILVSRVVPGVGATVVEETVSSKDARLVSSRDILAGAAGLTTGADVVPTQVEKILDMTGPGKARVVNSVAEAISFQGQDGRRPSEGNNGLNS